MFRRGRPHVPGQYTACSFGHIDDRSARSLRTVEESAIVLHVARGKVPGFGCFHTSHLYFLTEFILDEANY